MLDYESMTKDNERNDDMTVIGLEIGPKSNTPDIILEYEGILTQAIISHNVDIIEHSIDNISIVGKLSTLVVEITQNMMNYSKSHDLNCADIRPAGDIKVLQQDNTYFVKSKNILSIQDKQKIEPKLQEIQNMSEAEIKKRYRELRRSGENTHEKGGGIGFFEIAKLASNITYNFTPINEEKLYFELEVEVRGRRAKGV
jgi:hypothetical protein